MSRSEDQNKELELEKQRDKELFVNWILQAKRLRECKTLPQEERSFPATIYDVLKMYLPAEKKNEEGK